MVATKVDVITRVATYSSPIDKVWNAITSPENLVRWMCSNVKPYTLAPGSLLQMSWNDEHYQDARIVKVDPPHTFAWEWRPGGGFDPTRSLDEQTPLTTVTFSLQAVAGGTQVTLVETGFDALTNERNAQALADNNGGWDGCLANLTRLVESSSDR